VRVCICGYVCVSPITADQPSSWARVAFAIQSPGLGLACVCSSNLSAFSSPIAGRVYQPEEHISDVVDFWDIQVDLSVLPYSLSGLCCFCVDCASSVW